MRKSLIVIDYLLILMLLIGILGVAAYGLSPIEFCLCLVGFIIYKLI